MVARCLRLRDRVRSAQSQSVSQSDDSPQSLIMPPGQQRTRREAEDPLGHPLQRLIPKCPAPQDVPVSKRRVAEDCPPWTEYVPPLVLSSPCFPVRLQVTFSDVSAHANWEKGKRLVVDFSRGKSKWVIFKWQYAGKRQRWMKEIILSQQEGTANVSQCTSVRRASITQFKSVYFLM